MKNESIAVSPPVAVSALDLFGVALADWVQILTILYLLVLIGIKIHNHLKGVPDGESDRR